VVGNKRSGEAVAECWGVLEGEGGRSKGREERDQEDWSWTNCVRGVTGGVKIRNTGSIRGFPRSNQTDEEKKGIRRGKKTGVGDSLPKQKKQEAAQEGVKTTMSIQELS